MVKNYNEILYIHENIETDRLLLRKFRTTDAEDILEYASDPQTLEYLIWQGSFSIEEARANIYDYYWSRPGIWAVELKASGKVIGAIDLRLNNDDDKAGFGYVFNRSFWGKGYATETLKAVISMCFEHLQLNRVESNHYVGNEGSGRVMQKAGMSCEGVSKQSVKVKGVFHDQVIYGIIRNDYFDIAYS